MPWLPPCGSDDAGACPFVEWVERGQRPRSVRKFGQDRTGRQRWQCKACDKVTLTPPTEESEGMRFRDYLRQEAIMWCHHGNPYHRVAQMLGLHRATVARWYKQWLADRADDAPPALTVDEGVRGMMARQEQRLRGAPFFVPPMDEERFVRASVALLRFGRDLSQVPFAAELEIHLSFILDASHRIEERRKRLREVAELVHRGTGDPDVWRVVRLALANKSPSSSRGKRAGLDSSPTEGVTASA